jgi:hypothetical protein
MASVEVYHVRKSFGQFQGIHGVLLRVEDGEFVTLVGRKGVFPMVPVPFLVYGNIDAANVDRMIARTIRSSTTTRRRSKRLGRTSLRH